jgi:hypothetical protein
MDVKSYCLGQKLLVGHGCIINIVFTQTPTLVFGCVPQMNPSPQDIPIFKIGK